MTQLEKEQIPHEARSCAARCFGRLSRVTLFSQTNGPGSRPATCILTNYSHKTGAPTSGPRSRFKQE